MKVPAIEKLYAKQFQRHCQHIFDNNHASISSQLDELAFLNLARLKRIAGISRADQIVSYHRRGEIRRAKMITY